MAEQSTKRTTRPVKIGRAPPSFDLAELNSSSRPPRG
jgi:hypothetical protein